LLRILDRKLLRELYRSKGLLLAITSIIALGVMCYVAMQSAYHNLQAAKRSYYRQCRMADFWVDVKKIPTSELEPLARLPGVVETRSRIQFSAIVDIEDVAEPLNGIVISMPRRRQPVINDVVIRKGGYFTDRRDNEVIVNDSFAREHGLFPGQWIHLLLNNRRQELFIVGTAISSEFTYLLGPGSIVPDPKRLGVFYIKREYAEEVFDFEGAANQVVGRLSPDTARQPDVFLRRAETVLDDFGVFNATPLKRQASNQFLTAEIDGLGAFATVVPVIFLAVAALVLNVLITRLARQQRVVIGTLKALGYSNRQVFLHFLKFGLSVGLLGGAIGGLLGYLVSLWMTVTYRQFFEFPELRADVYWHTNAVGLVVSLACALVGSLRGARSVLRLNPAEAMRPEPPQRGGAVLLERVTCLWSRLTAGWRIALRNIFRHRLRTTAGLFAATMGAGLLVVGFMMTEGQSFFLDFQFHRVTRSDIDLAFKETHGRDALDEVRNLPGVDHAEPVLDVACNFVHGPYRRKGAVTGLLPDATLTTPRNTRGERIRVPSSGVVVSRALAEILHVAPGDQVTMIPIKGERRPVDIEVVRVADSYMGLAVYADIRYLSRLVGEEFAVSGAQLVTDQDRSVLNRLNYELKRMPGVQSITSRRDMIRNITETLLENQYVFIGLIIIFAGTIFFGSIVNASIVSLTERQREVATMRALGYGPWRIGAMFLRESMLITLFGTLLGFPVGYVLMILTAASYENELIRFPVISAPWVWWGTFLLAIVFGLLAHAAVQWNIHRMNFLEALQAKE